MKLSFCLLAGVLRGALSTPTSIEGTVTRSTGQCAGLKIPVFSGLKIISVNASEIYGYSYPIVPGLTSSAVTGLNYCRVEIVLSHTDDIVHNWIWLPLTGWNGRFLVAGGAGLAAGYEFSLGSYVASGYAAASTDAGLTLNNTIDAQSGKWAIKSPGVLNDQLIKNFAYQSIHDLAVLGKAVTQAYFAKAPGYSYYSGCSTGGRQGYLSAQTFPADFDGITANAPAIYTPRVSPGDFWPTVVMSNIVAPPQCVFTTYQNALISACDGIDGAIDHIVGLPWKCHYDTSKLVGQTIACADTNSTVTITKQYAEVVAKILQGARSINGAWEWYGVPPGAPFTGLASTSTVGNTTVPAPFTSAEYWIQYFVYQDPSYDANNMTFAEFDIAYNRSVTLFNSVIGTDQADLNDFQRLGKKLVTWHGTADPLISPQGSLHYRKTLERRFHGPENVNKFHRLFYAPGAGHCVAGQIGPAPVDPLSYLVKWVETGQAPATLYAATSSNGSVAIDRNLCPYPQSVKYKGSGDVSRADSFYCA